MDSFLIEIDWVVVGFFMLFFLAMALFYTLFITAIFKVEIKPPWLFFALFPTLLLTVAFIDRKYVLITLLGLFVLLAAIAILGKAYEIINDTIKTYKKRRRKESRVAILFDMLKNTILSIIAIVIFYALDPKLLLLLFIVLFVYFGFIKRRSKDSFLELQATLPTSKIRSLAMGLVEIKGITQLIEPLISRLEKKECIGYKYTIEKRSKNKDKDSYSLIHSEVVCNPFTIYDETGDVLVNGTDIDFIWLPIHHQYQSATKRYTQYLLLPNQEVILIGKATSKNDTVIIEKEKIKDVFTLALLNKVTRWNINRPMIKSIATFSIVFFILMALILMTNFVVKDNTVYINFDGFNFSIQHIINIFKKQ